MIGGCERMLVPATACAVLLVSVGAADEMTNERRALTRIVGDRHTPDSALFIHQRALAMEPAQRYAFLMRWVLPGDHIRLTLDFAPTHPAPVVAIYDADDLRRLHAARESGESRIQTGGFLVAPALDLVDAATELGKLDEVRARIEASSISGELQQRCRLALLGIVELAAGRLEPAGKAIDELFARVSSQPILSFAGRWPETLVAHACSQYPQAPDTASDLLYRMVDTQVRNDRMLEPEAWRMWATSRIAKYARSGGDSQVSTAEVQRTAAETYWSPVSRTTARSRGQGTPCARWRRSADMVQNIASHDEDYLYFRLPMRGTFQAECEVTSFSWRESHLMVAGTYVAPVYDLVSYELGSFRYQRPRGRIQPKLADSGDWIRYRTVVREGKCSTYFNGRFVHTEQLTPDHDPWLAIRSPTLMDGAVRNLRVTGNPTVPEQIRLSASDDLIGWNAYYLESVGGSDSHWRQRGDVANGGGIVGRQEPASSGAALEQLLQYHRPMLEDGTIEYEFYYRDGESHVYPALDRRAFVLAPDGVRIHWITDGVYERTGLSPLNLHEEPECRRGPNRLPLQEGAWNSLKLQLAGDAVELLLNGEKVYSGELEPTNQRTIGLFHWADQTEARVRNVVWRGKWPRQLPRVEEQEFAGEATRALDERRAELAAHFEHDFAKQGLPPALFTVQRKPEEPLTASAEGVRIECHSDQGYVGRWIALKLRVHGDFDILAEFEGLSQTSTSVEASCEVHLMAMLQQPTLAQSSVYWGMFRTANDAELQVAQAYFKRQSPAGNVQTWPGSTPDDSTAGTFRLARRGDMLYCLFAQGDSPNFRVIHQEAFTADLIPIVRLIAAANSRSAGQSRTAVTWKRVIVDAERIVPWAPNALRPAGSSKQPSPKKGTVP